MKRSTKCAAVILGVCMLTGSLFLGACNSHTHDLIKTAAKDASCTEAGNCAYWHCEECGKYFSDEAATAEIALEDTALQALGHDLNKKTPEEGQTLSNGAEEFYSCSRCGAAFADESGNTPVQLLIKMFADREFYAKGTENGPDVFQSTQIGGQVAPIASQNFVLRFFMGFTYDVDMLTTGQAVEVHSTDFALYLYRAHDIYTEVLTELGDTLEGFIRDMVVEYEVNKGREYPFPRFALTETPISFTGYVRNWKGYSEQVQPEYVFLPERGATVNGNMKEQKKRETRWAERDDRQSSEPVDIEMRVVRDFVTRQLEEETKWELEGSIFLSMATMDWNGETELNPYDISALFFNHAYSIYSRDFPVVDVVFNLLQKQSDNDPRQRWRRMFSGMTDAQRAAIYLDGRSFEQALLDGDLSDVIFYEMLKLKANYLKHYLSAKVSAKAFDAFIRDFTRENRFQVSSFGEFNAAFQERFHLNLMDLIPTWYTRAQTPIILVKGTRAREVSIEEHTRYLVDFQVYNPTDVEGVISVEVEERGGMGGPMGRRGGPGGMNEDREVLNYIIEPRKYKEIRILCDDRPNHMTVNTNIAQNIPSDVMQHFQRIDEVTTDTVTGIFDCDGSAFTISDDEIVVDNEDRGFRVIEANQKNKLQNFFRKEDEDKYKNLNFWSPPTRWTATVGTNFYGDYINSCMYKRAGNGNNKAEWTANIKRAGYYEVYVYIPGQVGPPWMNRDERYQYYTVKHDDGEDEISIQASGRRSEGWTVLGSFYFSEGKATVTLSDRGTGNRQMIFADAVKWVYANNNK